MLKQKVYKYYIYLIILLGIALLIFWFRDKAIVINEYDTYFVIYYYNVIVLLMIPVTQIGISYWYLSKVKITLSKLLSRLHITITIIGLMSFIAVMILYESITSLFFDSQFPLFDDTTSKNFLLTFLLAILILAQIIFIFNITISLVKYYYRG